MFPQSLRTFTELQKYRWEEALALILTLISVHGSDTAATTEVKNILKLTRHSDLETQLQSSWLLEKTNNTVRITDLALCFSLSGCDVQTKVTCHV